MATVSMKLFVCVTVSTTTYAVFTPRTIRQVSCLVFFTLLSSGLLGVGSDSNLRSLVLVVARRLWTYSRSACPRNTSCEGGEPEAEELDEAD